jgi:hypothetical protein
MNEHRSVFIDRKLIDSILDLKKVMDRKQQEIDEHEAKCKEKRALLDSEYKAIEQERDGLFKQLSDLFMDSPPGEPFNMFKALRESVPSSYNFTDPSIGKEAEERTEEENQVMSQAVQAAEASKDENDEEVEELLRKFEGGTKRHKSKTKTLKRRC